MKLDRVENRYWLIGVMCLYLIFTYFFWEDRHTAKSGSEIQYLEYLFVLYAIFKVIKNEEGNYYQIIFLSVCRLVGFLLLFIRGSMIKPFEGWSMIMPTLLILVIFLSIKIIRKHFPLFGNNTLPK
jgi:hypothetical protein